MLILVRLLLEMLRTSLFWEHHISIHIFTAGPRKASADRGIAGDPPRRPDGLRLVEGGESGSRHTPDPTQ